MSEALRYPDNASYETITADASNEVKLRSLAQDPYHFADFTVDYVTESPVTRGALLMELHSDPSPTVAAYATTANFARLPLNHRKQIPLNDAYSATYGFVEKQTALKKVTETAPGWFGLEPWLTVHYKFDKSAAHINPLFIERVNQRIAEVPGLLKPRSKNVTSLINKEAKKVHEQALGYIAGQHNLLPAPGSVRINALLKAVAQLPKSEDYKLDASHNRLQHVIETYYDYLMLFGLLPPKQHVPKAQGIFKLIISERSMAESWMQFAACKEEGPSVMVPDPNLGKKGRREAEAIAIEICRNCVVQSNCEEYMGIVKPKMGIWAGMSASRRQRPVRAARVAKKLDAAIENSQAIIAAREAFYEQTDTLT